MLDNLIKGFALHIARREVRQDIKDVAREIINRKGPYDAFSSFNYVSNTSKFERFVDKLYCFAKEHILSQEFNNYCMQKVNELESRRL